MPRRLLALVLVAPLASACAPVTPHYGTEPVRAAPPTPRPVVTARTEPPPTPMPTPAPQPPGAQAPVPASDQVGPPTGATYAPAPFRFAFQVGDELSVSVWKEKELETTQRIQRDGTIAPMLLGTVVVSGKTVDDVRTDLEQRYTEFLREPKVSVRVVSIHSERVFVLGEVKQPAAIALNGPTTLIQALAQAGGFNQEVANQKAVRIVRNGADGHPSLITANVAAMLTGRTPIVQVMPGDVVYVAPTGLADWSRGLTQALGPLTEIITATGSIVTSYAAIKALEN